MRERVPPLLWIRAFESAARQGSFLGAGKELSVSAAAVSRSIKELEASIGVALFVRHACGVELTEAGRSYALALAPALRQIAAASADIRAGSQRKSLRVSALPVLAQRWLVPRLGEFKELHPDITVTVSADAAILDLCGGECDVALRYDQHAPADCERIELFGEELLPVVSPRVVSTVRLETPADLFQLTALYDTYWETDWSLWLGELDLRAPRRWRGLYFTLYTMAVDAAVAGYGALIGHTPFIERELRSGELIAPFGLRVTSPKRYYALAHTSRASQPAVRAFLDWLGNHTRLRAGARRSSDAAICLSQHPACSALGHGSAVPESADHRRNRRSSTDRAA